MERLCLLLRDALTHAARLMHDLLLHDPALLLDERGRHVAAGSRSLSFVDDLLGEHRLGAILRALLELGVHVGAERDERVEADVLRELVVERREHALLEVA